MSDDKASDKQGRAADEQFTNDQRRPQPPAPEDEPIFFYDAEVTAANVTMPQDTPQRAGDAAQQGQAQPRPQRKTHQPHPPQQTTRKPGMDEKQILRIKAIAGWGCIVVAIVAFLACLGLYFSDSLPVWSFDEKGSIYTLENYEHQRSAAEAAQATIDAPDAEPDAVKSAENTLGLATGEMHRIKVHAMSNILMRFGALPSIILFVVWFVFANKQRKELGASNGKEIAKKTVLYIVCGFLFFNVLPDLVTNIVENIMTIIGLVVFAAVVLYIALHAGDGSGAATSAAGSGGTVGGSVSGSAPGGNPAKPMSKMNKQEKRETLSEGGKVKLVTVPKSCALFRDDGVLNGKYVGYIGGDGMKHYACSQDELDKGRVVIVDEKGNKRHA